MSLSGLPLEREELKSFMQALSRVTGLSISYFPPDSDYQELVVGESSFCLQLKTTVTGAGKCQAFLAEMRRRALASGQPEFDLCHARMGEVAVPLVTVNGDDIHFDFEHRLFLV